MKKLLRYRLASLILIAGLVLGGLTSLWLPYSADAVDAGWVVWQQGRPVSSLQGVYKVTSTTAAQAVTDTAVAGRRTVIDQITITSDTACLVELVMETTGTSIAAWYVPAYGVAYGMSLAALADGKKIMVKTSTTVALAINISYHFDN
jgi:hypothetical protein